MICMIDPTRVVFVSAGLGFIHGLQQDIAPAGESAAPRCLDRIHGLMQTWSVHQVFVNRSSWSGGSAFSEEVSVMSHAHHLPTSAERPSPSVSESASALISTQLRPRHAKVQLVQGCLFKVHLNRHML